ncbi:DNA polymerase III subunit gamma/tau, partial [bacterium]|nr:DNA polymerase III subunit gamma/tau [bacterium]
MAQTLYRKYRSQRFSEILGQKQVIRILRNSIQRQRLNHAYLFSGPRGTGKTSVARIFAKALNCENLQEGDACAECSACNSIRDGNAMDVIEIDAASNRGIDDIRQLRERVNYAPVSFPYKVYIIDEAHMITGPGFNALLKTLEEPPSHVVFCLCTTEPHKLPLTIISRCIRFDFQRLPADDLANHLGWIAEQEGFSISAEAAAELCNLGEGSARDAISLLEQLSVYCDGGIELTDIRELFQLVDPSQISAIVEQLHAADPSPALASWERLAASGTDAARFLLKIAGELKRLYLEQPRPKLRAALEALWQGVNLLKHDSYPTLVVELALLKAHAALVEEAVQPAAPEETQAPEEESVAPLGEAQQAEAEPAHPEEAAGEHRHRPSTGSPGVPARDS